MRTGRSGKSSEVSCYGPVHRSLHCPRMTFHAPDERYRRLTPEVLSALSADDIGDAIVQHVHWRVAGAWGREMEVIRTLPPGVRAIYATWLVDAEVNNGGFNQYFFNSSGRYSGEALAGYELLGAEEYAAVMRSAIATFEVDRQRLEPYYRAHTLESFSESYGHTDLGEVDQRYYALGDRIYLAWAVFVQAHPDAFMEQRDET